MTKIVFIGSGPVAAKSLELLQEEFYIEAVVTKPRPAHHKGRFPVLDVAEKYQIDTLLVSSRAELDTAMDSHRFASELAVLVDFGIIVSQKVIDSFPRGILNSHFSLLPQWRGADPITFAILSGQEKTGVSLMLIDEGMDTGKIIKQQSIKLPANITGPQLTDRLIILSDEMLKENIPLYLSGKLKPRSQPHPNRATYSRKLTKQDGRIDWTKPAEQIEREVRAFLGWPGSKTVLANKEVTITAAHAVPSTSPAESKPGEITVIPEANEFGIATSNGTLYIDRLKPAGKKEMTGEAFIAGHKDKL